MAAAAIGLFVVAHYWGNRYQQDGSPPPAIAAVLIRPPIELPEIELRDASGQPFTAESFAGHWTLLAFGDASRAPGHLAVTRMIEVHNRLASEPDLQAMLLIVLATRDQDPTLARDFGRLSPALRLLSGEAGELQHLRASLGASPGAPAQETADAPFDAPPYYLIGPAGRLLALFPGAQTPSSIASDLSAIFGHADSLDPTDD